MDTALPDLSSYVVFEQWRIEKGGKKKLFVCVHLSIRELKLGMRDECWRGTPGD